MSALPGGDRAEVKVVVLGRHDAGKTCLINQYLLGRYTDGMKPTVGGAFGAKKVVIGRETIVMGVWDTAGSERYESMSRLYYKDAKIALLCYDVTDIHSFEKLQFWLKEVMDNEPTCRPYIVGTKCDLLDSLPRAVSKDEMNLFLTQNNLNPATSVYETSAKSQRGITELFDGVARDWIAAGKPITKTDTAVYIDKKAKEPQSQGGTCCG
ncbi:RAB24, member RAS oncogene family [Pelomyxa schiedti]|nr:RAB24, member RAS oncogene family [Pelomyxa schiedti]